VTRPLAIAVVCTGLAACGAEDDGGGGGGDPGLPRGADLAVVVLPQGLDGPRQRRRVECERLGRGSAGCRRLAGLDAQRLAPVPPDTACAEIYGGPDQARVRGTLRGDAVDARFSRVNSCEIERWDRNVALLGAPSGAP
jgi:hypothetical protein